MLTRQDFVGTVGLAKSFSMTLNGGYDLSTCDLTWRIALAPDAETVVEKTKGSGITITNEGDDTVRIDISLDDIDEPGLYYHSLAVTPAGGARVEAAKGRGLFRGRPTAIA